MHSYWQAIACDLYLLRGADTSDYLNAATYYWNYLINNNGAVSEQYVSATKLRGLVAQQRLDDPYSYSARNNWGYYAATYTKSNNNTSDVITSIPSSANAQFGTMLMRVADIFGYTPTSSQNTETSTNSEGEEEINRQQNDFADDDGDRRKRVKALANNTAEHKLQKKIDCRGQRQRGIEHKTARLAA